VTRSDREAVAQILALPDGPWEFSPGHATAASYFAAVAEAGRYHMEIRDRLPVIYHYDPRPPRPKRRPPGT
jgi:hypothetical protein